MVRRRIYAERQRSVERNTDFSVTHLIDSDHTFRENFTADAAEQLGARVRLRTALGMTRPRRLISDSKDGR